MKVSKDGSVICSYNADDYGMFQNLCHFPAAKHVKGTMRRVVNWDTNAYTGDISEAEETYNVVTTSKTPIFVANSSNFVAANVAAPMA